MLYIYASFGTALALSIGLYQFLRSLARKKHITSSVIGEIGDNKALFVTAHPDDECMFFSPTIYGLQKDGWEVYLLCLSTGNFEGLGTIRQSELLESCRVLGIPKGRCDIIDHKLLPDHPDKVWDAELLANKIAEAVITKNINAIITFDDEGVSGHINHCSLAPALRRFVEKWNLDSVHVYLLESVCLWRKYGVFLDAPLSYQQSAFCYINSISQCMTSQHAMLQHRSQMVWYRWLYILFSRYLHINTLHPLDMHGDSNTAIYSSCNSANNMDNSVCKNDDNLKNSNAVQNDKANLQNDLGEDL